MSTRPSQQARSVTSSNAEKQTRSPNVPPSKPPSLPRRLLFPHLPPDADLPPLLLSPSASPELNAELYDFIAIALRAYVNPWWTKITRYDKEFLPQITQVLTSVLRTLEVRLTATDFSPLVFRDLPTLLDQHYVDYRLAQAKLHTSYASGGAAGLPQLFHQMQPHMAITAEGEVDEAYVRQAVDQTLKICLPEEDYEAEPERYIIREIVVNVLLKNVIPRLAQPWFIHKTILDLMGPEIKQERAVLSEQPGVASGAGARPPLARRKSHHLSFQSLAIFFLSSVQSISSGCLAMLQAYRQTVCTIKKVNQSNGVFTNHVPPTTTANQACGKVEGNNGMAFPNSTLPGGLWPTTSTTPATIPSNAHSVESKDSSTSTAEAPHMVPQPPTPSDYTHPILHLLLALLSPPPPPSPSSSLASTTTSTTTPPRYSYSTSLALTHVFSIIVTLLSPFLSRLLPYLLYTHILSPASLSNMVRTARKALFPEGWPAPPPVDPTPEEQVELRRDVERRLLDQVPGILKPLLGPTQEARAYTMTSVFEPLGSQACNVHLFIMILDLVIVTVFPEMAVKDQVSAAGDAGSEPDRADLTSNSSPSSGDEKLP